MGHLIGRALAISAMIAATASAQGSSPKQSGAPAKAKHIEWTDLKGEWTGRSMRGTSDTVITAITFAFADNRKVTVAYPNRAPLVGRVLAIGGDSVVVDYGPYPSLTRAGHGVANVHNVLHISNHRMTGTFLAKFDDGQTLAGHLEAAQSKR